MQRSLVYQDKKKTDFSKQSLKSVILTVRRRGLEPEIWINKCRKGAGFRRSLFYCTHSCTHIFEEALKIKGLLEDLHELLSPNTLS